MTLRVGLTIAVLLAAVPSFAQAPQSSTPSPTATASTTTEAATPKLERIDELERDNIRLTSVVSQLQLQLSQARAELVNANVTSRAAAFTEKMKKTNPDFIVDPQTLELTPKPKVTAPTPTPDKP